MPGVQAPVPGRWLRGGPACWRHQGVSVVVDKKGTAEAAVLLVGMHSEYGHIFVRLVLRHDIGIDGSGEKRQPGPYRMGGRLGGEAVQDRVGERVDRCCEVSHHDLAGVQDDQPIPSRR